jgi:hypothetical protein
MTLLTSRFSLQKPETTDAVTKLRIAIAANADICDANLSGPIVSTLPGSPFNGQEILFQNAAMASIGALWQLKYRTAAAGSYKWECKGGTYLIASVDTSSSTLSTSSFAAPGTGTVGPVVTVPLAGDYDVTMGFRAARPTSTTAGVTYPAYMGFARGAAAVADADIITTRTDTGSLAPLLASGFGGRVSTFATAGEVLTAKYQAVDTTIAVLYRSLGIRPVRVG